MSEYISHCFLFCVYVCLENYNQLIIIITIILNNNFDNTCIIN
jgi:hypothetical protein